MQIDTLIYVSQREYERLQLLAGRRTPAFGWWLCGFAGGLIAAVALGWAR